MIHQWQPWRYSTDPRTPEGKAKVGLNAFKGGQRQELRELARILREQIRMERKIREIIMS